MDELTIDQLRELVLFYKQRVSDSEFNLLQTQLKVKYAIDACTQLEHINRELQAKIQQPEVVPTFEEIVAETSTKSKRSKSI
jgi:hypothetical protein